MNNPPYFLVDEFGVNDSDGILVSGVCKAVQDILALAIPSIPFINYQYGYFDELVETLLQYSLTSEFTAKKFPLIWLEQPYTTERNSPLYFGETLDLRIFIIMETDRNAKAASRMISIFKPKLYPIYSELLNQIKHWPNFDNSFFTNHLVRDYYFWEDENNPQVSALNDVVDCIQMSRVKIKLLNNLNC